MAADVLLYNSLNETIKLASIQLAQTEASIAAADAQLQAAAALRVGLPANAGPNQAGLWCLIPTLPASGASWTGGISVCDTSGYYRCGSSCTWTVPGGVTCARFQIWGAGAGTGYGCCCAFTPFGGTGAYASVIMPVTAGNSYTLCSGCAYCCCATAGGNGNCVNGCPSYVTGTGLTNFCAEGGEASIYCQALTRCQYQNTTGQSVPNQICRFLGGCICDNNSVCWHPTIQGGGQGGIGAPGGYYDLGIPVISSCRTFKGSATVGTVYGIRGSFGGIKVNCNGSIWPERVSKLPP